LLLVLILIFLVAGNNMATAVGTLVGSNIANKRVAKIIGIAGFSAGLIISGSIMLKTARVIFNYNSEIIAYLLIGAIIIFIIAQATRVPLSLTMALVGISIGLMIRYGRYYELSTFSKIVFMWFLAPIFALSLSFILVKIYSRIKFNNIWKKSESMRILIFIFSFASAYTLGENTMGLILSIYGFNILSLILSVISIALGSLFLSDGVLKRIGQEIFSMNYSSAMISIATSTVLVELASLFSIPLSNSQAITFSILGVAFSNRIRFLIYKPIIRIISIWIISPLMGIGLGLLI